MSEIPARYEISVDVRSGAKGAKTAPLNRPLILGSSSRFRADLLARLGIAFTTSAPEIDEQALPGESIKEQVRRLALVKAQAVASSRPEALVIGSDQLADLDGQALGKPLTESSAVEQLLMCSGKAVVFRTGLCLLDGATGKYELDVVNSIVRYRVLTEAEAQRYVAIEQPLHSAGSIHVEARGPAIIDSLETTDPSAIVGLPLISLCGMLRTFGVQLP